MGAAMVYDSPDGDRLGSILIVEDDGLLSMMMEEMMRDLGAGSVRVCSDTGEALRVARNEHIDCAILDIYVHGISTYEVADVLSKRQIPFIFCSGIDASEVDARYRHRPFLAKPYGDHELRNCLTRAIAA